MPSKLDEKKVVCSCFDPAISLKLPVAEKMTAAKRLSQSGNLTERERRPIPPRSRKLRSIDRLDRQKFDILQMRFEHR